MTSEPPLRGRIALVTGASRGIGRAAALELARLGAAVALVARSAGDLEHTAEAMRSASGRALAVPADIGRPEAAGAVVAQIEAELGPVDILVNNAALMPLGPLVTSDPAEWRAAIEVNLIGAYDLLRAVLPGMLARGWGRVVNVSTKIAVMHNLPNRSAYATSKAALDRLTTAAAAELTGTGIAVNAIYPGVTDTPMQAQLREAAPGVIADAERERWRQLQARGELHPPEDGARLIAAVVLSDWHGQIVDLEDEQAKALLRQYASH